MKAIILAGGYGTRLGSITKKTPKCTIKINGKEVINHIIDRLYLHGITDILVNLHYLPDCVMKVTKARVVYYYEPRLLGHNGTLQSLKGWLRNDDFFVVNGDTISNVNYGEMAVFHRPNTITALMDEWRVAGTWFYSSYYFEDRGCPINPYRPHDLIWHDIGTPERLIKAKEYYEPTH